MTAVVASPPATRPRPVLAAAIVLVVLAALWWQSSQGANAAVTVAWHYACVMHVRGLFEWFTSAADFWKGLCLQ